VVELAAEKSGWGQALPARSGRGIAVHRSFVAYVAAVVQAEVDARGNLSVPCIYVAVDCGPVVNTERVRAQFEGAAVMGYSLTTRSAITYERGRVQQNNFNDYEVTRIDEAPREVHAHIVANSYDVPLSGVGEPGLPPVPPALCNAIFAAMGKRIRSLPIADQLQA